MSSVTMFAIAFLPAIIGFPFYVWFVVKHRPKSKGEKVLEKAKRTNSIVTGYLVKEKTRSVYETRYDNNGCNTDYADGGYEQYVGDRTNGYYKYTVNDVEYKYCESSAGVSVEPEITLYYDCDNPKVAYTDGLVKGTSNNGCLLKLLWALPLLEPWIVLAILVNIFNVK